MHSRVRQVRVSLDLTSVKKWYNIFNMSSKLSNHIGRQLQIARQNIGLTQAEAAKQAGTNTNYYAKLERGEAVPSLKMLEKVIKALGIKSSDVLPF